MLDLPKRLFWDTNMERLDWDVHARFVIDRIIKRGNINHWKAIKSYYGLERIKHEIPQIRDLGDLSLNFFSEYFDIPLTEFRYYQMRGLMPEHILFHQNLYENPQLLSDIKTG